MVKKASTTPEVKTAEVKHKKDQSPEDIVKMLKGVDLNILDDFNKHSNTVVDNNVTLNILLISFGRALARAKLINQKESASDVYPDMVKDAGTNYAMQREALANHLKYQALTINRMIDQLNKI